MAKKLSKELQIKSDDLDGFFNEFLDNETLSDRDVSILGGAILDIKLRQLLQTFFIKSNISNTLLDNLTFAQKNQLAYILGLLSSFEYKDIASILSIRNKFAHELHGRSFTNEDIQNEMKELLSGVGISLYIIEQYPSYPFKLCVAEIVSRIKERIPKVSKRKRKRLRNEKSDETFLLIKDFVEKLTQTLS